jgi:type I restriction enzyme S subunit
MQLLEHFKELSLHPKNAEELKGLILQLAVQGKLTENWRKENPYVEPATVLLEKIELEKQQLIAEKKIKKEKPMLPIEDEVKPYELSEGWAWCRVGQVSTIKGGKRIPKGYQLTDMETPHIYIRVTDMKQGTVSFTKLKYITPDVYKIIKAYTISKDDLYITIAGTIGDVGVIPDELHNMNLTENAAKIVIYQVDKIYLKTLLSSNVCQSQFLDKVNQMAQPKLALHRINSTLIPLPPIEEQKAIVEVVNQLFSEVEQLADLTKERIALKENFATSALQRLTQSGNTLQEWNFLQQQFSSFFTENANIKKLRETILQLAVQGKLTKKWRDANPDIENASELLKRIEAEKQQLISEKKIKKEKPLPPIGDEDKPFDLPEGWAWCRLGTVTDIIAGASFKSGDFNQTEGTKCIKITNAGVREFVETNDFLPENFENEYPNYLIKEGDLILALTRPYIKNGLKISICPSSYHNSLLNQRVASIRSMSKNVYHPYLFTFIQSPKVLNHYRSMFEGKSQQPNMKMGDITELIVSIPPLEEQKTIVDKVNSLMVSCDELEQQIDNRQTQIEQLMQSCLKEFSEK